MGRVEVAEGPDPALGSNSVVYRPSFQQSRTSVCTEGNVGIKFLAQGRHRNWRGLGIETVNLPLERGLALVGSTRRLGGKNGFNLGSFEAFSVYVRRFTEGEIDGEMMNLPSGGISIQNKHPAPEEKWKSDLFNSW